MPERKDLQMHIAISPGTMCPPFANYSHGVLTGQGALFVSGQLGVLPDGTVPEDTLEQALACFGNVERILFEAGLQKRHVVRINAFVTDREHLRPYMEARDNWIGELDPPPASTLVIVSGFARPEFKVEVEITACV